MHKVQQIEPISHIQTKPTEVLAKLDAGPVILAQRSKAAAVLVSVVEWDNLIEELEDLRTRRRDESAAGRTLTDREWAVVKQGRERAARGGPTISHEELKAQIEARAGHVANRI